MYAIDVRLEVITTINARAEQRGKPTATCVMNERQTWF